MTAQTPTPGVEAPTAEPKCIRCGGTEDLMDVAMAPGMTYCAPCRRALAYPPKETAVETAPRNIATSELTLWFDETHWFPFVEDENCNITGPGHQDETAFAAAVNHYDAVCGDPCPDEERWTADDVSHAWVVIDEGGEAYRKCPASTEDAVPVTTLWGVR